MRDSPQAPRLIMIARARRAARRNTSIATTPEAPPMRRSPLTARTATAPAAMVSAMGSTIATRPHPAPSATYSARRAVRFTRTGADGARMPPAAVAVPANPRARYCGWDTVAGRFDLSSGNFALRSIRADLCQCKGWHAHCMRIEAKVSRAPRR